MDSHQIYFDQSPLCMKYVFDLIKSLPAERAAELSFVPYQPRWPEDLDPKSSIIEQVRRRDQLLFFPFDGVDPFLQLLREAAERGVRVCAWDCAVTPESIAIRSPVPVSL